MRTSIKLFALLLATLMLVDSCRDDENDDFPQPEPLTTSQIILHHYQNDAETKADFEVGMQWCFSFLGATLEKGSWARGTQWVNANRILIDIEELGFNENANTQLKELIRIYKESGEYRLTGGIDAGRFVVSIFNNPNHYYKIVGVPSSLNQFQSKYLFLPKQAAIIESAVAFKERAISMPLGNQAIDSLGYWAQELSGSLKDSSHIVEENEVMDIMQNGQLRFGIYNKNKQLITGGDSTLSIAGKPAKCLWCHEVNIQVGFAALTAIPGYYSPNEFDSIVNQNSTTLRNYRAGLNTEVDFDDNTQHTELEKLYIRFMEPSAKRLAAEWRVSEQEVKLKLVQLSTHKHDEFQSLGDLYYRSEVDQYSPYQVIPSIKNARETVSNEPNLLP